MEFAMIAAFYVCSLAWIAWATEIDRVILIPVLFAVGAMLAENGRNREES